MTMHVKIVYYLITWLWGVPIYIQVAAAPPIWARPPNDRKRRTEKRAERAVAAEPLAIRPYLGARDFQLLFRIFAIVSGLTSPIYKPSSQHLKSSNKMYLSA